MTEKQTTAGEILRMIENVSPDDAAKLDEIDGAVSKYIGHQLGVEFIHDYTLRYTRSRDVLKAIRPEGWAFKIIHGGYGFKWWCEMCNDDEILCRSSPLKTEELAELHAIISAIAHERSQP